jgi:hypothetical protein
MTHNCARALFDRAFVMKSTLLVFADDWGRHPSSAQHLVGRLAGRHRMIWGSTVGTRKPRPCPADLVRGLAKAG